MQKDSKRMAERSEKMDREGEEDVETKKMERADKGGTGKDPLVCPKCECYYEYKGEVCLKDGVSG